MKKFPVSSFQFPVFKFRNILLILVTCYLLLPTPVHADSYSIKVNFQGSGVAITDQSPIITWDLPADKSNIVAIVVRLRKNANNMGICSENSSEPQSEVREHWFYKSGFNPSGGRITCHNPSVVVSDFSDEIPTEYVIPPAVLNSKIGDSGNVYFNIWVVRNSNGNYVWEHSDTASFSYSPVIRPLSYNPFGIDVYQYYVDHGNSRSNDWKNHLTWARNLVGNNGYVKLFFPYVGFNPPIDRYNQVLREVYTRGLTPVVRIEGDLFRETSTQHPCWIKPQGSLDTYESNIASFVGQLAQPPNGKPLYIEVWNEPNYTDWEWCNPDGTYSGADGVEFGRFYLGTFFKIDDLNKPYIKVMPGGLGSAGYRPFLNDMMTAMRDIVGSQALQHYVENWGVHSYPNSDVQYHTQPTDNVDNGRFEMSPFAYKDQLAIIGRYTSNANTKVFITEGGYKVNKDISFDQQSGFTQDLLNRWVGDPKIAAIMPHALDANDDPYLFANSERDPYEWVQNGSGTTNGLPNNPNPVYTASRNTIKSYLPAEEPFHITGYKIAEGSQDALANAPINSFQSTINYTFSDTTPGLKIIFVEFIYSSGFETRSIIQQATLIYRPDQPSPIPSPVESPAPSPVASPVASPIESPIQSPVESPVESPISSPVESPIPSPISSPSQSPVSSPIASPIDSPVASPTESPISSPVASPVESPPASPVASPQGRVGDVNGDGAVNILDIGLIIENYGREGVDIQGDANHDGIINILDIGLVVENYDR